MDPLSITASIVTILQLTCQLVMYFNDIKDAPEECRQCIVEACNLQSLLISLRYRIEDGWVDDSPSTSVRALNAKDSPLDQYLHILNQLHSKLDMKGGAIKRRLIWKFSKAEITRLMTIMERLKTHIGLMLNNDHFELSQLIKYDTKSIRTSQEFQEHTTIMEWLSPADFQVQQPNIITTIHKGAGKWFLDTTEFKRWLLGLSKTLLCTGIPGGGKTTTAAIIVNHLWSTQNAPNIGVASLFCSYKWSAKQNSESLIAALMKQLLQPRPDIITPIKDMYEHHNRRGSRPSLEELLGSLESICSMYRKVYIVVDALDECPNTDGARDQLIDALRQLQGTTNVQILCTSRQIPEVVNRIPFDSFLEIEANEDDVQRFLVGQIPRLPNCVKRDEELKQKVLEQIAQRIDGMFLLARFYIDHLLDKRTKAQVLVALETLPKGSSALNTVYDEVMKRIDGQPTEDVLLARRALCWITNTPRPLTTIELCHALAIRSNDRALDRNNIYDINDIISVCLGLVTVDERNTTISLVHYTTHEYLKSKLMSCYLDTQEEVARACITYLSFDAFQTGRCITEDAWQQRHSEHALFGYLAQHWSAHVRPVQNSISSIALSFLCDETLIDGIGQAATGLRHGWADYLDHKSPGPTSGLHLTAMYGLSPWTDMLVTSDRIQDVISINSRDWQGRTPLSLAAGNGHQQDVELLIKGNGVEVDTKDKYGRTPLLWAAKNGHHSVVRLLIEQHGVDPDSKDQGNQSPLSWAARCGHATVVDLLLEKGGVDVNSKAMSIFSKGETPLSMAARNGHTAVVKLLLGMPEIKVNVKCFGMRYGSGRTPLSLAAENGHLDIVELLVVRQDTEIDLVDDSGRTPLSYAAGRGHEAVVDFLIKQDNVKVDSKDREGRTTLSWAASGGNPAVLRLLIEQNRSMVDFKDNNGRTPLSYAVLHKGNEGVRLLLNVKEVEADSKDKYGRTPFLWAVLYGNEAAAIQLANRTDVNVDIKDPDGWTPLSHAARQGHREIVQLLLERDDVEVGSKDFEGRTPLSHAAATGQVEIVQLLLQRLEYKGNSADEHGRTAIYYAARGEKVTVVRLLLKEKGWEADIRDKDGRTPLSRAAERGNEEIVRLLLEHGNVDPDSKDCQNRTPLSYAAGGVSHPRTYLEDLRVFMNPWKDTGRVRYGSPSSGHGHEEVIRLLLRCSKVNIDSKDKDGKTPQCWAMENGHERVVRLFQASRQTRNNL